MTIKTDNNKILDYRWVFFFFLSQISQSERPGKGINEKEGVKGRFFKIEFLNSNMMDVDPIFMNVGRKSICHPIL